MSLDQQTLNIMKSLKEGSNVLYIFKGGMYPPMDYVFKKNMINRTKMHFVSRNKVNLHLLCIYSEGFRLLRGTRYDAVIFQTSEHDYDSQVRNEIRMAIKSNAPVYQLRYKWRRKSGIERIQERYYDI